MYVHVCARALVMTSPANCPPQPVGMFITKCIQLYEMTVLRHGLMTVGPTGGGKTCALRTLQAAMTSIAGKKDNSPADAARCVHLLWISLQPDHSSMLDTRAERKKFNCSQLRLKS